MKVTGIEHCEFVNKEGSKIQYDRVSLLSPISPSKGEGERAETVSCSTDKTKDLVVGDEVICLYNRYGKVERFDYVG